jgi:hypothetical protein
LFGVVFGRVFWVPAQEKSVVESKVLETGLADQFGDDDVLSMHGPWVVYGDYLIRTVTP